MLSMPELLESLRNTRVLYATLWLGANDAALPDRGE